MEPGRVRAVFFDFGGVIAEEGFREGLRAIGHMYGLDPEETFRAGRRAAFEGGYAEGRATEAEFWKALRAATGIHAADAALRREILERFVPRPRMIEAVERARGIGLVVCLLSDQTNWLEELDAAHGFLRRFDRVFNSFKTGKTKLDPSAFTDACRQVGVEPSEALMVDDSPGNIGRARDAGLRTMLFTETDPFIHEMCAFFKEHAPSA